MFNCKKNKKQTKQKHGAIYDRGKQIMASNFVNKTPYLACLQS